MKAVKFENLTFPEKAWLLYSCGKYLVSLSEGHHKIHLFSLESILIELYYNENTRLIDNISRADYQALDKYLPCIVIESSEGRMNDIL
jgi:hypothetical protein